MKSITRLLGACLIAFMGWACQTNDVPEPERTVTLSAAPAVIAEAQGVCTLTVTLSGIATREVSVVLSTSGAATAGTDYTLGSATLTIPIGSNSATTQLTAIDDMEQEGNEEVLVAIASVSGALEAGTQEVSILIEDDDVPIQVQLLLNEICYDPSNSGLDGDTNGDGVYAQADDEFVELINMSSQSVDLSGYKIYDAENLAISTPNHIIPANTILPPGGVLVVFGGGNPTGSFGGAIVQTSTSGDLNLNNAGDVFYLYDANDVEILTFDIEPLSNNPNESYTRNPDLTGDFVQHSAAVPGVLFSPGTKIDGSPF